MILGWGAGTPPESFGAAGFGRSCFRSAPQGVKGAVIVCGGLGPGGTPGLTNLLQG
jgi:hypothetical protein